MTILLDIFVEYKLAHNREAFNVCTRAEMNKHVGLIQEMKLYHAIGIGTLWPEATLAVACNELVSI